MLTERESLGKISDDSIEQFILNNSHGYQHKTQIREAALKISELLDGLPYGIGVATLAVIEKSYSQYAARLIKNLTIDTKG